MLQQTQTYRVLPKYEKFIKKFPDFKTLARVSFSDILSVWSGLGYNRRAKYLLDTANIVWDTYKGVLPTTIDELIQLPGIGKNTAGALMAFAFDMRVVFVETNIRRVFIHEFFGDVENVDDKEIMKLIKETLPDQNFREWYYALMDYGAYLGKLSENPNKRSKHYTVQSKFEGSRRQVRGGILKALLNGVKSEKDLFDLGFSEERLLPVLDELLKEGLIVKKNEQFRLA